MIITDSDFAAAMEAVVEERGEDFVYPRQRPGWFLTSGGALGSCRYVRSDEEAPGCIVGAALAHCGVPLSTLRQYEGRSAHFLLHSVTIMSDVAVEAAFDAQEAQDRGRSAGYALTVYREMCHSAL